MEESKMLIITLALLILTAIALSCVANKIDKLRNENQTYYIGMMVRENKLDLIANQLRSVVEEIEDVEGYSSAKEYLPILKSVFYISNSEYFLDFDETKPVTPIPPQAQAAEPTAGGGA